MGNLTDFNSQKMHVQMHGRANFRDLVRFQQAERRRRWFLFLDVVAVICAIFGYLLWKVGSTYSYWLFGVTLLIIVYFIFRKFGRKTSRTHSKQNFRRRKGRRRRR